MIKLLRVDHRLLHGQVAMAWTQSLDSDCILIANDAVVNDNIRKTTMKLAKPNGVKLVMKNIEDSIAALNAGVTDKYKLFIVVESIEDAYRLAKGYAGMHPICFTAEVCALKRYVTNRRYQHSLVSSLCCVSCFSPSILINFFIHTGQYISKKGCRKCLRC